MDTIHISNSACLAAAKALQALSHLQPGFASNVSPRLTENQRQQSSITNTQLSQQTVEQSGQMPQNVNNSMQSRLQSCFPTIASRQTISILQEMAESLNRKHGKLEELDDLRK
ncbi:Hypothetical predicted protein [Paramuricea clavata]|uniref:Uncharacterized protein n=1 Tax=Paramuricea clavata TaxID=317549 RepID=A0A6S7K0G2_PARCT|nr:Hypothetical predicted protein [Paramuricea clavata]